MKGLLKTLQFIYTHPLNRRHPWQALARFFKWQLGTRLLPQVVVVPFVQRSKLFMYRGLKGVTQNWYCGLQEFEDMAFLLHFLRAADQFVDIGANVGSYTVLAASEVGATTTSIEPIPSTFQQLKANVSLNEITPKVQLLNMGLGATSKVLHFTKDLDTTNHVSLKPTEHTLEVEVKTFDQLIEITKNTLVKIDVEGFETEVLQGMSKALKNPDLRALIIELNGSGKRYGYEDGAIHQQLLAEGYQAFYYYPFARKLEPRESYSKEHNTIYVKDVAFVRHRLRAAPKIKIHGQAL